MSKAHELTLCVKWLSSTFVISAVPILKRFETAGVWCLVTVLTTTEVVNMQLALCDVSNVIVVEIENTFGVLNDGRGIKSDLSVFALTKRGGPWRVVTTSSG